MTTARDIVNSALRKIHVLGVGSSISAQEADDALKTLNSMIASYSAGGNFIYTQDKQTFSLTSADSYTIGEGGDFDTDRPLYFNAAYVSQGGNDYPLYEMDAVQYANITTKGSGVTIPDSYYFDANYPLATIYLYPRPSGVSTITLYSFSPVSSFSSLDTVFSMPPEYESFLSYNLAVWLAPEYEREASATVQRIARETRNVLETQANRNKKHLSNIDIPSGNHDDYFDINRGGYLD